MSVGQDTNIKVIYVKLLEEGTDVWRPVLAKHKVGDVFTIEPQEVPVDEEWEFSPGDSVVVEDRNLSGEFVAVCSRLA
jgi:hypothetical protein